MKGTSLSQSCCSHKSFGPRCQVSSAWRVTTSHLKRVRTGTACKAQAAGSPTLEKPSQTQQTAQQTDIVVIGSGIGGLCCAALLAKYGLKVACDQHTALPTQSCSQSLLHNLTATHRAWVTCMHRLHHTPFAHTAMALLVSTLQNTPTAATLTHTQQRHVTLPAMCSSTWCSAHIQPVLDQLKHLASCI